MTMDADASAQFTDVHRSAAPDALLSSTAIPGSPAITRLNAIMGAGAGTHWLEIVAWASKASELPVL
jgi:hypothetical protein